MKKLFYSPSERILFYVSGYGFGSLGQTAHHLAMELEANATKLAEVFGKSYYDVQVSFITKSRRYSDCWVYYLMQVHEPSNSEVFNIGDEWTMEQWLAS